MDVPSTLIDLVHRRSVEHPCKRAYTFLFEGEEEQSSLSYQDLEKRSKSIAGWLQARIQPGDRVLLLLPTGADYVTAFLGCVFAGATAVPAYPPRRRVNKGESRIKAILRDAVPSIILTSREPGSKHVWPIKEETCCCIWQEVEDIDPAWEANWSMPVVDADTTAFIQYTSGSTASPKGVVVSHGNLLHNQHMIQDACGHDCNSTFVGWLPLYHDMGLVGNMMQPLYIGAHCVLMAPAAFIQKPVRWLRAISEYRAHTSGGPNFAYELCTSRISSDSCAGLDLSSWRVAFNGAEPVREETLTKFSERFSSYGFDRSAFAPCYGLAEASLIVSCKRKALTLRCEALDPRALEQGELQDASSTEESRKFVSCGSAVVETEILIVDPDSLLPCSPNRIGEIWIHGPGVARGYWNRKHETEETFDGRLANGGPRAFLRTGDLGFLRDGELFVTGRLKDVIIIRGLNHYAEDIEWSVKQCHTALATSAAFGIDEYQEEKLVIVAETDRLMPSTEHEVFVAIRTAVSQDHQIEVDTILLVRRGGIPRTSSGKLQRTKCKELFIAGQLPILSRGAMVSSNRLSLESRRSAEPVVTS